MLVIKPVQTKDEQKRLCERCGILYRPADFAYAAYVDGSFVGLSQFTVCDEYGILHDLAPLPGTEDLEALFIMGRQTLNWIDLLGIHICHCRAGAGPDKVVRAMGFRPDTDGTLTADMTHMFDGHCGGNCNIANELK